MFIFFFEQDAIDLIEQALLGDETLVVGEIRKDFAFDYILPEGCMKLGFPPRTAIEIKKQLVPGLQSILINDAKNALKTGEFNLFLVIYEEGQLCPKWISEEIKDFVLFLSKEQLIEKASSVGTVFKQKGWKDERDLRIGKLRNEIREGQNTLFVGAGLSVSLGVPGWDRLLRELAKCLKSIDGGIPRFDSVQKDSHGSHLIAARYLQDTMNREKLSLVAEIRKLLYQNTHLDSDFLDAVIELLKLNRIGEIITYNYDTLLEQRMTKDEIRNMPVDGQNKRVKNKLPVMHVHGVIHPEDTGCDKNVVLSEDEYHQLYRDSYHWANVAQLYALTHTTCVFVGLSMTDPSLRRLLDIAYLQGSGDVDHYAFLIREEYSCHKETEELFSQMGVNIIWCEDRDDVPQQIMRIV